MDISNEELDKLNLIFKSGNVRLALALIESQGYDLKDVLYQLYYTYRDDQNHWSLDSIEYNTNNNIALRDGENGRYLLWLNKNDGMVYKSIEKVMNKLTEYLEDYKN